MNSSAYVADGPGGRKIDQPFLRDSLSITVFSSFEHENDLLFARKSDEIGSDSGGTLPIPHLPTDFLLKFPVIS
jgi:hypothetical protein